MYRASDRSLTAALGPLKTRQRALMTATQQRRIEKYKDKRDKHVRKHVMKTPAGSSELLSTDTVKGEKTGNWGQR